MKKLLSLDVYSTAFKIRKSRRGLIVRFGIKTQTFSRLLAAYLSAFFIWGYANTITSRRPHTAEWVFFTTTIVILAILPKRE